MNPSDTDTVTIRATFEAYEWVDICTFCGSENISEPQAGTGMVVCGECGVRALPDTHEIPREAHGWVDPMNPWGSLEQDVDDDSCPPDSVVLPFGEAIDFLLDFPGGVWEVTDCEPSVDWRTGRSKSVTAHVDGDPKVVELLLLAFEKASERVA